MFGYEKQPLRDIAMYHMMREDAVEKAKARALKKMKEAYPESRMKLWNDVREKMKSVLQQMLSARRTGSVRRDDYWYEFY